MQDHKKFKLLILKIAICGKQQKWSSYKQESFNFELNSFNHASQIFTKDNHIIIFKFIIISTTWGF